MSLERIVEHLIMVGDNDTAEVIYRQAAVGAGRPGLPARPTRSHGSSSPARDLAAGHVHQRWQRNGPPDQGVSRLHGQCWRAAAEQQHPELRAVITGLSVAGVEGSLKRRYGDDQSPRHGVVRAKTERSTRCAVSPESYAPQMARCWHSAFLINNPKNEYAAMVWLDRVTTALSTCGSR